MSDSDPTGFCYVSQRTDERVDGGYPRRFDESGNGKETAMNLSLSIGPLVSLLAGILILIMPKLLNYIVAVYLIVIGLLGLFGANSMHLR